MKDKILVVDDELMIAHGIKAKLNQMGYENVFVASTGEEAVRTAFEMSPDVIIMDIKLGEGMDGIEAAEMICSKRRIPVVYLTGYTEKTFFERAQKTNLYGYMLKPYDINDLRTNLEIALHKSRAEKETAKAHQTLLTVLNSIEAFIYVADMKTFELLFVNDYGKQFWGDVKGEKCWQVLQKGLTGPCGFCTNDKLLDDSGNPKGVYSWEFKNLKNRRWYDCRDRAIRWIDGRIVRLEIATDIHDRKKIEEDFRRSNLFLDSIVENIPNMIFIKDAKELRFVGLNRAGEELLGYSRSELRGKNDYDFFPKEQADFFTGKDRNVLKEKTMLEIPEEPLLTKDKGLRILRTKKVPILNPKGDPEYLLGIAEDITIRKQAEEALRKSEEKVSSILNSIEDGVWSISLKDSGQTVYMSPSVEKITGVKPDELKKDRLKWTDFVDPDYIENIQQGYILLGEKGFYDGEIKIIRPDGKPVWVRNRMKIIYNDNGEPERVDGVLTDINMRKQAEEALRKSEEKVSSILNSIEDGVTAFSIAEDKYIYLSPSVEKIFCRDIEQIREDRSWWRDVVHPDDIKGLKDARAQAYKNGFCEAEFRIIRPDGKIRWVRNRSKIIYDEKGLPERIDNLTADITGHKNAEEALRESEERFRSLALSSTDAVVIADEQGEIVFCNSAVESITGYTADELIGKSVANLRPEKYREFQIREIEEFVEKGESEYINNLIESFIVKKNGEEIPVEVSTISWEQGGRVFMGGFIRDLTDRKKREEYEILKRNFDSLETFLGWFAHDINNLHAGIFGCMEIALNNADNSDAVKEWLKKATKPAENATALIKKFMLMTQASKPNRSALCIEDEIKSKIKTVFDSKTDICFRFQKNLPMADADRELIEKVIQIIIENASEAMPEGGRLDISAEEISVNNINETVLQEGKYIKIVFKDSGCGMDTATKANVFVPYFSTKQRGTQKGMGLSLPLAYSIIRQHEGHIEIESEKGKGTEVKIWLPVFTRAPVMKTEKGAVTDSQHASCRRVLVLDDEEFMRDMIAMMLDDMEFEHELASRGEDAVESYFKAMDEGSPFGLIVLDLTIKGGMGGLQTLKRIKQKDPSVKAIVMSGYSDDPVIKNYKNYGFYAALPKPFHLKDFEEMVRRAIQ